MTVELILCNDLGHDIIPNLDFVETQKKHVVLGYSDKIGRSRTRKLNRKLDGDVVYKGISFNRWSVYASEAE